MEVMDWYVKRTNASPCITSINQILLVKEV